MMKSKRFKTKVSHAHSLILSLCLAACLVSLARSLLGFSHLVSLARSLPRSISLAWSLFHLVSLAWSLPCSVSLAWSLFHLVSLAWSLCCLVFQSVIVVSQFLGLTICQCISLSTSLLFRGARLSTLLLLLSLSFKAHVPAHTYLHTVQYSTDSWIMSLSESER